MSTATVTPSGIAPSLRRLYFVRFGFALIWAAALVATMSKLNPLSVTLLVLYPVFDVAAAVVDARSAKDTKPGLYMNMAISLLAGIGLALAASSGIHGVLRVWGIWAIVSGLIQLAVALARRGLGGQWPMIVSGAISTVAGASFIVQAAQPNASLTALAGYATLGGIFFLVSAIRLGRVTKKD
ncbi:MAG TPA: hypothetical protein VJ914_19445 [Pseudonocardiaceae bacterium]|nr:hypothetical protein [Pseudonocardiaceae bacterium]